MGRTQTILAHWKIRFKNKLKSTSTVGMMQSNLVESYETTGTEIKTSVAQVEFRTLNRDSGLVLNRLWCCFVAWTYAQVHSTV